MTTFGKAQLAKPRWTKFRDSWLVECGDVTGWAGPASRRRGYTTNLRQPIGRDGVVYSGGGHFSTLNEAKRFLEKEIEGKAQLKIGE